MATASTKVKSHPSPSPPESTVTKQEQPHITSTHNIATPPPDFTAKIAGIRSLSSSLSAFLSHYDELNDHLNSIRTSIHSNLPDHLLTISNRNQLTLIPSNPNQLTQIPLPETSSSAPSKISVHEIISPEGTTINCEQKPDDSENHENPNISNKPEPETIGVHKKPVSSLDHFCKKMCGRGLKRYVATNVSDVNKLREEVPNALTFAKDPAKLVFESIGRFYVQGSNAYTKDSTMVSGRLASVIILESFLLMNNGDVKIGKTVYEDAEQAAVEWRQRLKNEGGFMSAEETDARGLLLLISGYGIPAGVFDDEDIRDLIRASNVKEISTALRCSKFLVPKIPEIIDQMVKDNMEVEAVDMTYSFGLEDKCSAQTILNGFLRNNMKNRPHGSSAEVKEAIKKQRAGLKSIIMCLEAHKVDPSMLLPELNLNEKLQILEKEIYELDMQEKATQKRKAKEAESLTKAKHQEAKRSRLTGHDDVLHEQKAVHYRNSRSPYNGRLPSNYINVYSTSSVLPEAGLPVTVTSSVAVESERGLSAGDMLTNSYSGGVYGGTIADKMANARSNGRPYDWHGDTDLVEKYLGRTYLGQSQTYDSQPLTASGLIRLYSRPEGLVGSPNHSSPVCVSGRKGSGSDLYHFADSVVESESYLAHGDSGTPGISTVHPYLSSSRSSYLN